MIVGADPASQVYVRNKVKMTEAVGMNSIHHELPEDTSEADLLKLVDTLNQDAGIHGILVQLPCRTYRQRQGSGEHSARKGR